MTASTSVKVDQKDGGDEDQHIPVTVDETLDDDFAETMFDVGNESMLDTSTTGTIDQKDGGHEDQHIPVTVDENFA
jgi:hypothetical protein